MLHFTWWGIIYHMANVFADLLGWADWTSDLCVQTAVIAGVWYMSACQCGMLVDTEEEMGGWGRGIEGGPSIS